MEAIRPHRAAKTAYYSLFYSILWSVVGNGEIKYISALQKTCRRIMKPRARDHDCNAIFNKTSNGVY